MNDTATQQTELISRRLTESLAVAGKEVSPYWWLAVLIPVLVLGLVYVGLMYRRDARSVHPLAAAGLGLLRAGVYAALAALFLLPARQAWERSEKRTRVLVALDVSPSVTSVSDDLPGPSASAEPLPTRLDKVVRFLTDEQVNFLKRLTEKNPVYVYRFGSRLDEEAIVLEAGETPKVPAAEWSRWAKLDLRDWLAQGVSDPGKATLTQTPGWDADKPATPEWAGTWLKQNAELPESLSPQDRKTVADRRGRLEARADLARQLTGGTNVGQSLLTLINREASNLISGVVVVSDGRSNQGSDALFEELRQRARKENVPVFSVLIGEERQQIAIRITDVQAPERTAPDEKFVVRVEIDGEGLPDQEVQVALDLYKPGSKDVSFTLPPVSAKFQPGDPPHAQAEFQIDPEKLPQPLKSEATGYKELVEGDWRVVARVPKDPREAFTPKEHASDPATVAVVKKPLRVLLFAGGPMREYQFLRTLLVREKDAKRAELSIYLQNEGRDKDVQDVEPERRLIRFPTRLRVEDDPKEKPEEKYYNLAQYDLVIAFDPDWKELTPEQVKLLQTWVEYQAGGLILVGGPVNTYQLARGDDGGTLRPLLDLFPVLPGDSVLQTGSKRSTKNPWRLNFGDGADQDATFLKLDDESPNPLAGWEEFFTGKVSREEGKTAPLKRGFYNFYPIQTAKPGAKTVFAFADPAARTQAGTEHPFLVTMQFGKGRVAFLGSAEMWRLREFKEAFYERFWLKFGRWASAGTRTPQNRRGVLVMGRQFTAGQYVRAEAQLFGPSLEFLPESARPKFTVTPAGPDADRNKKLFDMRAKQSAAAWAGWFQAKFVLNTPGDYNLELQVPDSGDILRRKFTVKESNPELDNTRPDPQALAALAGDADEVLTQMTDKAKADELRRQLRANRFAAGLSTGETGKAAQKLVFDLSTAGVIPDCLKSEVRVSRNRGPVEDVWDRGPSLGTDRQGRPMKVVWALLLIVGLLSAEWLGRKLLRLA